MIQRNGSIQPHLRVMLLSTQAKVYRIEIFARSMALRYKKMQGNSQKLMPAI